MSIEIRASYERIKAGYVLVLRGPLTQEAVETLLPLHPYTFGCEDGPRRGQARFLVPTEGEALVLSNKLEPLLREHGFRIIYQSSVEKELPF